MAMYYNLFLWADPPHCNVLTSSFVYNHFPQHNHTRLDIHYHQEHHYTTSHQDLYPTARPSNSSHPFLRFGVGEQNYNHPHGLTTQSRASADNMHNQPRGTEVMKIMKRETRNRPTPQAPISKQTSTNANDVAHTIRSTDIDIYLHGGVADVVLIVCGEDVLQSNKPKEQPQPSHASCMVQQQLRNHHRISPLLYALTMAQPTCPDSMLDSYWLIPASTALHMSKGEKLAVSFLFLNTKMAVLRPHVPWRALPVDRYHLNTHICVNPGILTSVSIQMICWRDGDWGHGFLSLKTCSSSCHEET